MKQSDSITKKQLTTDRGWKESKIQIYLGSGPYRKSIVIKTENYLTKIGINFKGEKNVGIDN